MGGRLCGSLDTTRIPTMIARASVYHGARQRFLRAQEAGAVVRDRGCCGERRVRAGRSAIVAGLKVT